MSQQLLCTPSNIVSSTDNLLHTGKKGKVIGELSKLACLREVYSLLADLIVISLGFSLKFSGLEKVRVLGWKKRQVPSVIPTLQLPQIPYHSFFSQLQAVEGGKMELRTVCNYHSFCLHLPQPAEAQASWVRGIKEGPSHHCPAVLNFVYVIYGNS